MARMIANELAQAIDKILENAAGSRCAFVLTWSPKPHKQRLWIANIKPEDLPKWLHDTREEVMRQQSQNQ